MNFGNGLANDLTRHTVLLVDVAQIKQVFLMYMLPIDNFLSQMKRRFLCFLQDFVHPQMHSLYNVTTIVENPSDVFGVDCASEVWIAMVGTMLFVVSTLTGMLRDLQEIIPNEVFGPRKFPVCTLLFDFGLCFRWHYVVHKFREVIFQLRPTRCNFFLKHKKCE